MRHLAFQAFVQMRVAGEPPILSRNAAHRLFLRELKDYRAWLEPARALSTHPAAEVRLLGESWQEAGTMALERSLQALACAYAPGPLLGALERLRSGDEDVVAIALEYLSHLLPRPVFEPLSEAFEQPADDPEAGPRVEQPLGHWIRLAWASEDAWLRACAVRASRHVPDLDVSELTAEENAPEIVRSELAARVAPRPMPPALRWEPRPC